jgi:monolysocardiolipin acyltransferase
VTIRAASADSAERLRRAEEKAVARWHPGMRWYHPIIGRTVIAGSKFVTRVMNRLDVEGREHLEAVRERGGRGLLTISNHVSLFDDPLITSNFVHMPYRTVRWVGADAINFFGNRPRAWFYTAGKLAPIVRGSGIDQPGMHFLRERLQAGDWVHMFPEGGRTRDPEGRLMPEFKTGCGWLIEKAQPLVLPFYHYGMHRVLPVGSGFPRPGNRVRVLFGEPLDCDSEWIDAAARRRIGDTTGGAKLWEAITGELYDVLAGMERRIHPNAGG